MEENELIQSCLEGNKQSLEKLIGSVQEKVFNLALRFLWSRPDAEDATQEILIKIITNLSKFEGHSKFSTWSYRIAVNYLINLKQTKLEQTFSSFSAFAQDLSTVKKTSAYDMPDKDLMVKEMKTGCTMAMLQCLDRNHRVAFILGSVFKIKSTVAAEVTATTPANFRKRLETSRKRIGSFLNGYCGVYNLQNSCRCNMKVDSAISSGRISKASLNFVGADKVAYYNEEMEELNSLTGIYENHGQFKNKGDLVEHINGIIATKEIVKYSYKPK